MSPLVTTGRCSCKLWAEAVIDWIEPGMERIKHDTSDSFNSSFQVEMHAFMV